MEDLHRSVTKLKAPGGLNVVVNTCQRERNELLAQQILIWQDGKGNGLADHDWHVSDHAINHNSLCGAAEHPAPQY